MYIGLIYRDFAFLDYPLVSVGRYVCACVHACVHAFTAVSWVRTPFDFRRVEPHCGSDSRLSHLGPEATSVMQTMCAALARTGALCTWSFEECLLILPLLRYYVVNEEAHHLNDMEISVCQLQDGHPSIPIS